MLFPLRVFLLFLSFGGLVLVFTVVDTLAPSGKRGEAAKRQLVQWMCCAWVAAWHGVIRCVGAAPPCACGQRQRQCRVSERTHRWVGASPHPVAAAYQPIRPV